jgi:hypothetical protein
LMNDGQSAANTKLDRDSAAYKALVEKHSYTGPATVFGRDYQANYAPLMNKDGKLTGALLWGSRNSDSPIRANTSALWAGAYKSAFWLLVYE